MIVVKHVDSIFGSLLPIRLSTFKLVYLCIIFSLDWILHQYQFNRIVILHIFFKHKVPSKHGEGCEKLYEIINMENKVNPNSVHHYSQNIISFHMLPDVL